MNYLEVKKTMTENDSGSEMKERTYFDMEKFAKHHYDYMCEKQKVQISRFSLFLGAALAMFVPSLVGLAALVWYFGGLYQYVKDKDLKTTEEYKVKENGEAE